MSLKIALSPNMGATIVRHLSKFGALPNRGILAGQAVDSAITDLFGSGGGIYNDLDIFRPVSRLRQVAKSHMITTTASRSVAVQSVSNSDIDDGYSGMKAYLALMGTYNIESVSRKDMLNFVNCTAPQRELFDSITPQRIISGFDLNCVRVAVDLSNNLLYWDKHYAEFIASRQLKVVMMHTPWHTFGRFCKKLEELPSVFANTEQAALACSAFASSNAIQSLTRSGDVSLQFGQKYMDLMKKHMSAIEPYFSVESKTYEARGPKTKRSQDVTLYQFKVRSAVPFALQDRIDRLGVGSLFYTGVVIANELAATPARAQAKINTLKEARSESMTRQQQKHDFVLNHLHMFGSDYVRGQAVPDVADKVTAFLRKHGKLRAPLFGLSLADQWTAVQRLKRLATEYGAQYWDNDSELAYGLLENLGLGIDFTNEDQLRSILDAEVHKETQPFETVALDLPDFSSRYPNIILQELMTPGELRIEGKELVHCVGGYSPAVRSGRSRILRIRTGPNVSHWSTVELHRAARDEATEWVVAQHRGRKNKEPSPVNKQVLDHVMANLALASVRRVPLGLAWVSLLNRIKVRAAFIMANALKTASSKLLDLRTTMNSFSWKLSEYLDRQRVVAEYLATINEPLNFAVPATLSVSADGDADDDMVPF